MATSPTPKLKFLREFKKFLGEPFEEDAPGGLKIKVLGQGCVQCDRLEQEQRLEIAFIVNGFISVLLDPVFDHAFECGRVGRWGRVGQPGDGLDDARSRTEPGGGEKRNGAAPDHVHGIALVEDRLVGVVHPAVDVSPLGVGDLPA